MPVRLSQMQNAGESRTIHVDFGEAGDLNVEINPNKFTKGLQRNVQRAVDNNDIATVMDLFFSVVKSWDLQDDDGNVLPLTEESTDQLSIQTFGLIMEKLGEAVNPKAETSNS